VGEQLVREPLLAAGGRRRLLVRWLAARREPLLDLVEARMERRHVAALSRLPLEVQSVEAGGARYEDRILWCELLVPCHQSIVSCPFIHRSTASARNLSEPLGPSLKADNSPRRTSE
jgi:hypothetical protein